MAQLFGAGFLPCIVDTGIRDGREELIARALDSDVRVFVIHGDAGFPFHLLAASASPDRHIIGTISWESAVEPPNLHRMLSDYAEGGRLVARYLHERGHRHVLLMGTSSIVADISSSDPLRQRHGWGFAGLWREMGGTFETVTSLWAPHDEIRLDEDGFLSRFRGGHAPTAIFGLRDLEAWHAQSVLLRQAPDLATSVDLIGHGNTPWSNAGHPPFATVDLNLEEIAGHTMKRIEAIHAGTPVPSQAPILVPPRIIRRG